MINFDKFEHEIEFKPTNEAYIFVGFIFLAVIVTVLTIKYI